MPLGDVNLREPYCLAMILCDAVHKDPATGKSTLLGTFSTFGSVVYPAPLSLHVYFALTDGEGTYDVKIRLVNSKHIVDENAESVFEVNFNPEFPDPLCVIEGSMGGLFSIPEPGVYHCEILCDENVLMSRRIVADKFEQQEERE